jgi:ABC-2 type transport system ATP-binding protein
MKQRLAVARALIHDPQVVFLDEPTSGLDPEASRQMTGIIREMAADRGKTIFLCTHNLGQAQDLCSRVAMISAGRILAQGSRDDLSERLWDAVPLEVEFQRPPPAAVLEAIGRIPGVTLENQAETTITLRVQHRDQVPAVIRTAVEQGGDIVRVSPRENSLEEIYFAVQEQGRNAA